LAKSWLNKEVVLPFLDGLGEVPSEKRVACVKRINEYRAAHPGVKFAVSCREAEYKT
jgi:predicted NACHT family NTPase